MNVFGKSSALPWMLAQALLLCACSEVVQSGPAQVSVIQPTGAACSYQIAPALLSTLESVKDMRGLIGRVATTKDNLGSRPEILDTGVGLNAVDVQFSESNGVYTPRDLDSLFAASLYYAIERAHLMFASLDPSSDMVRTVPGFKDITTIVHDARRSFGRAGVDANVTDNAEFLPHTVTATGQTRNYLISYPTDEVSQLPLGLNLGIMAHEYTHLIFNYLFYNKAYARNLTLSAQDPTERTLQSFDEGNADYFGFLASKDPGFFLCSYPTAIRDLATPKKFSQDYRLRLETDPDESFDAHEGGAIWASINYQIGLRIGHEANGALLVRLMSNLLECSQTMESSTTLRLTFKRIASCHVSLAGSAASDVRTIYNQYLDAYGGI